MDERLSQLRRNHLSAAAWIGFAALVLLAFALRDVLGARVLPAAVVLAVVAVVVVLVVRRLTSRRGRDPRAVARFVEDRQAELDTSLLAAVELEPDLPGGRYGFLAKRLIDEVLRQAHHSPWVRLVPDSRLHSSRVLHTCAAVAFGCLAVLLAGSPFVPALAPKPQVETAANDVTVVVVPGDAEVERGRSVLVTAEFAPERVPADAALVLQSAGREQRLRMGRSLDDPILAARIGEVGADLAYRVEWRGGSSPSYRLEVFDHPELTRSDVLLRFPEYTGKEEQLIEDTRRVTAPERTEIELICRLNKPVAKAELLDEEHGTVTPLSAAAGDASEYRASFVLEESLRLELALVDDEGRTNRQRTLFVIKVTTNRRPEIVAALRDVRVSPLEELTLSAHVLDDFGLRRYGLAYRLGGEEEVEVVLGEGEGVDKEIQVEHTIALEELQAEPSQLVSFHFWAEDVDAGGEERRTTSDLYFGEVRPFEEIFREGQSPAGGQQGGGGGEGMPEGDDLARLQRDVLLATWNVIQSEVDDEGSLLEAVQVVRDGQADVRKRLRDLSAQAGATGAAGAESGELDAIVSAADGQMDQALRALDRALAEASVHPLSEAIGPEAAASQKLLELRNSEFDVARNNQQSAGGSRANASSGPSQAQLEQLDLTNSENRYETQRQAQLDQDAAGETRQALSRLKELARRQRDLNDRLRELQSELEAAKTEEERAEVQRRLKRLQEAQEEILRDTDELQQRMQESTQRERVAAEDQRLEETRENVRRASEALEEGRLSQAQAEGSRAQRNLSELEQDLRDSSSGQFDQRMRDLQEDARRLEDQQGRLAQELQEQNEAASRSLSEETNREDLQSELERQEADLERLLESMENTMQEAEETEPLLAEELFEALNEARDNRVQDALEMTREMLERGFPREAEEPELIARRGLIGLRQGVEDAAESVLGTGVEALERASAELERLTEELEGELARGQGQPGEGQPGEGQGEAQPGETRPGGGGGRRLDPGGPVDPAAPLTGEDFLRWSDTLRDVEEIIDDPDLSAEAARLRSRARTVREEFKRHSKEPNWGLVEVEIARPLSELGRLVEEELRRRKAEDSLVPIDRDPVPPEFEEAVRRYYERLGRSK